MPARGEPGGACVARAYSVRTWRASSPGAASGPPGEGGREDGGGIGARERGGRRVSCMHATHMRLLACCALPQSARVGRRRVPAHVGGWGRRGRWGCLAVGRGAMAGAEAARAAAAISHVAKGLEEAMGRVARARKVEAGAGAAGTLGARLLDHREAIPPPISGSLPRHRRCGESPRCEKGPSLYQVVTSRVSCDGQTS